MTFADRLFPAAASDGEDGGGDPESPLKQTGTDFDEASRNLGQEVHVDAKDRRDGLFGRALPKIAKT